MSSNGSYSLYQYEPSKAAPIVFYVLLAISTIVHVVQLRQFKFWKVMGFMTMSGTAYTSGFILRHVSAFHSSDLGIFIATILLIFLAPPIYAAVNYFILGRILGYIPYLSPIHPGRVVTTFIALDLLVEILTGQGASRVSRFDEPEELRIGTTLIKTALILLLALYCTFIALQIFFHMKCRKAKVDSPNLRGVMNVLYASNVLIMIRNIYRVVDSFLGYTGYTERNEWCIYVFEATPMLLNTILLNVFHPAIFLPKNNKVYLCPDGKTERLGPGWKEKRSFLATFFDPFDLVGLCQGKDNKNRYWENETEWPMVTPEEKAAETAHSNKGGRGGAILARVIDPLNMGGFLMKRSQKDYSAPHV